MDISFSAAAGEQGSWVTAKLDGSAVIGAHLSPEGETHSALTVFWHGSNIRRGLESTIRDAEKLLMLLGAHPTGRIYSYGDEDIDSESSQSELSAMFVNDSFSNQDAFRIEIESEHGEIILWANVTDDDPRSLDEGGENIGICIPPAMFNLALTKLITPAIARTSDLSRKVLSEILAQIPSNLPLVTISKDAGYLGPLF